MPKKKRGKNKDFSTEIRTEEEHDAYMTGIYGFEYLAGYTDSGLPYGIPIKQEEMNEQTYDYDDDDDDEIPF